MREILDRLSHVVAAMRHPGLRRLELAWAGCITAEMAQTVGLAVVAYRLAGLPAVGLLGLARAAPAAALGPFVASVVDRRDRGRVLVGVLVLRAGLLAWAAVVAGTGLPDGLIFATAALDALVYTAWWPTQSALVPELASSPAEATAANISTTVVENLGTLVGPLTGAALLALGSPTAVFAVAAGLLAAAAVVALPLARPPRARVDAVVSGSDLAADDRQHDGVFAGFRVALRSREPRTVIALYLAQTFALGALGTLVVAGAVDLLDLGDEGIGLLNAAIGVGGLVGALGAVVLVGHRRLGSALGLALAAWGGALLVAGTAPAVAVVVAMLGVVGAGNAIVDVAALTLLQRVVPDGVLVRVLGVFEGLWWAMLGAGALVGASLAEVVGPRRALLLTGAVLPVATALSHRSLRALDEAVAPPAAVLERLRRVPFFAPLSPAALERLAFAATGTGVVAGTAVVTQGEHGDAFYVIEEGEFEVSVDGRPRRLEGGAFFGEVALLRDVPRTATVRAVTSGRLLRIPGGAFLDALSFDRSFNAPPPS